MVDLTGLVPKDLTERPLQRHVHVGYRDWQAQIDQRCNALICDAAGYDAVEV